MGFGSTRDFSALPRAEPLQSLRALMGTVDIVYTLIYHTLGGECRIGGNVSAATFESDGALP